MLKLLQRSIPFTILAVLCATVSPGGARAQVPRDAAVVYQEHIDALNRGDAATAAAVFTSDGVLIIVGCPAGTGCVGAAIQARIQASINANARAKIVSIQRNNNIITAVEEHRGDAMRAAGVERAVFKVTMTFTGDKIARRVLDLDLSDPQTARFAAFLAPPASAPAAAVVPPATGDGGLISSHRGQIPVPEFAALLLSVLLAGLIMTRRRV